MKFQIKWGFLAGFFLFLFLFPLIGTFSAFLSFVSITLFIYLNSEEKRLKASKKTDEPKNKLTKNEKKDATTEQSTQKTTPPKQTTQEIPTEIVFEKKINLKAFFEASKNNDIELIELFLKDNVQVDSENEKGVTALMIAVKFKSYEVAQKLIENNANPNKKTLKGTTALQIAEQNNDQKMIEILTQ